MANLASFVNWLDTKYHCMNWVNYERDIIIATRPNTEIMVDNESSINWKCQRNCSEPPLWSL